MIPRVRPGDRKAATAFRKGRAAYLAGVPIEACPYPRRRLVVAVDGRLSWGLTHVARAWRGGWQVERDNDPNAPRGAAA